MNGWRSWQPAEPSLAAPASPGVSPAVDPIATASVAGRVVDALGGPIAGAAVSVSSEHPERLLSCTLTRADGGFELHAPPGPVRVLVRDEVYATALQRVVAPAGERLQLSFDPEAPEGDPQSSASVQAEALRLNEALRHDPSQLEAFSQRYAPYREHWFEGRGLPEVTAAVREVNVGEVLRVPARVGTSIVVGRRIAAHAAEPVAALSELPLGNGSHGHRVP